MLSVTFCRTNVLLNPFVFFVHSDIRLNHGQNLYNAVFHAADDVVSIDVEFKTSSSS